MMKILKEKNGTTMVEAAVVMPLVILSVMAMIYLLINIYSTVSLQSHMHLLLREESGIKSNMTEHEIFDEYKRDKIRRKAESAKIRIISKRKGLSEYVEAQKDSVYITNMMINSAPKVRSYGKSFVYNESDIVRFKSIVTKN